MVISLLRSTAKKALRLSKTLTQLVLVRASTSLSLQSILLICNICFFYAGKLTVLSHSSLQQEQKVCREHLPACRSRLHSLTGFASTAYTTGRLSVCACSGVKKLRRARFAAAVRSLADMDEEGLKTVVRFLPAWVKVSSSDGYVCIACFMLVQHAAWKQACKPTLLNQQIYGSKCLLECVCAV